MCSEKPTDELVTGENSRPFELQNPNELNTSRGDNMSESESEVRKKFWNLIKNQLEYGDNTKVKETEKRCGPFPFDDRLINDNISKTVVGPLILENGAMYYGHWYSGA